MDDLIRYVSLIDATETEMNKRRNWNTPHPKWCELKKRIVDAPKNELGEWELKDVFSKQRDCTHYLQLSEAAQDG